AEPEAAEPEGWTQDDLDNLQVGDLVRHRSFGVGPIVGFPDGYIVVRLGGKDRQFASPGAFEAGFLSLD
ncbi:MAG: hypothetical protein IJ092_07095, partial [Atopobiaceae bacterium]|nr:hypothetical protein [Atopobiaceae bacterium]